MAPPAEDYYCRQFQPNTFDPDRCGSCLRPSHMHLRTTTAGYGQTDDLHEWDSEVDDDDDDDGSGALSEGATSASSDDVSGGWTFEWNLVHSLSPEWELENCDSDIQSSFPNQWDNPERSRSLSSGRQSAGPKEMTRLDSSPPRDTDSSWMDERRGRDLSRRASESRGDRDKVNGYFSPDRRGDGMEEDNKRLYRYYERGHPLPSNYVPEPKACVPYRNVNLGLPSQRRNTETYMQPTWRSESPQRYTYHSNFRRGADSQMNSPTRHSSVSPDRYKLTESPVGPQRGSSLCRSQARSQSSSHGSLPLPSQGSSRHTSGRSSPSRRRGSAASRTISPTRTTSSHRRTDSSLLHSGGYEDQQICSRESRSPSQASNKHSLDSEKLYRNLESISRRGSSAMRQNVYDGARASPQTRTDVYDGARASPQTRTDVYDGARASPQTRTDVYDGARASPQTRTDVSSLTNTQTRSSRQASPSRNSYSPRSHTSQRQPDSRDSRLSRSQGSWQGSSHSVLSLSQSHGSSSSRRAADSQNLGGLLSHAAVTDIDKADEGGEKVSAERSRSSLRRGMEVLLISEPKKAPVDPEEVGMNIDDYIMLADIPKIQVESEEEFPGLRRRNESPSPCRDQRSRTFRHPNEADVYSSRLESEERRRGRERGRDRREKYRDSDTGRSSRRHSAASFYTKTSDEQSEKHKALKVKERAHSARPQTQWRKHWFVLGDSTLRFYRDSEAEESDDLEGEIDLTSCVNVSDCDVDKNYGLQIQTRSAVFTLSAITSRIQRNWVKLLKQAIQSRHQSDSSSEKENPRSRRPSSGQPSARFTCRDSGYEAASSASINQEDRRHRRRQTIGDPGADLSPASQREEAEGWDREQAKRLEERNKWFEAGGPLSEMGSRWDSMELKKGSVPVPTVEATDSEVSRKWAEFETLSFGDTSVQSFTGPHYQESRYQTVHQSFEEGDQSGSQTRSSTSNEALSLVNGAHMHQKNKAEETQKEVVSLRKQVETITQEHAAMEVEVDSPCGPRAPCRAKLEALVVAHRKALQELQEKHALEKKELEEDRDQLLQERSQAAAKDLEALKAAHREELEREVEKARRLSGGAALMDSSCSGHMPEAGVPHSELNVMSERFSQKCLELNRAEQSSKSRDTELDRKQRELEQLQRENQELKNKLAEEISRMRYFITGQRSDVGSICKTEDSASDLEMQLKAKENELQYLKKEISCLQNEVQSLTKEKEAAYKLYKEAYVELSDTRGRSQLEMSSLNEHLKLANAALQEGAEQT